jgi:hypothetical protein
MPLFLNAIACLRAGEYNALLYPKSRDKENFSKKSNFHNGNKDPLVGSSVPPPCAEEKPIIGVDCEGILRGKPLSLI